MNKARTHDLLFTVMQLSPAW